MTRTWTAFFAVLLLASLMLKLWLSSRQVQFVERNAHAVPAQFADSIALHDHRRAAQYTVAKQRLGMVQTLLGAAVFVNVVVAVTRISLTQTSTAINVAPFC